MSEWGKLDTDESQDVVDFETIDNFGLPEEHPKQKKIVEDEKITNFTSPPEPKHGGAFNINLRDLESIVSSLTAVEMQLQNNVLELKKLDNISARAKAINEVDTDKILSQFEKINFDQITHKIVDTLQKQLESQRVQISKSSSSVELASAELTKKSENLILVADGFKNLDNMADDLSEFIASVKKWRNKNMFIAIGLSLFFGLFSGVFVSNFETFFKEEPIQNGHLLTPKFGKIAVLPDDKNKDKFYLAFGAKELTQVEILEENAVKYIVIHAQK